MPVTVNVMAPLPTNAVDGLIAVMRGSGRVASVIVKVTAFDDPAPGAGLNTVMVAVPAVAISDAGICAVTCVTLSTVVGRSAPFQRTTEPGAKFVPVTESWKVGPPATDELGLSSVMVGGAKLIVSVTALEVPPPGVGLTTVIAAVPPLAISVADIVARSSVAETNCVGRS